MRPRGEVVRLDFSRGWQIISPTSDPVVTLAAAELAAVLHRVTGNDFPIAMKSRHHKPAIALSCNHGEDDGFSWQATSDYIELHGHNRRGLLYAVYSFLEALGCRWVAPGMAGERIPSGVLFDLPDVQIEETPTLPGRCLIIGHYVFMQEVESWIAWAAQNRLNTIFLHVIEGLAVGAAPEKQWQRYKSKAVSLARQRGMTIEHGGHGLAALLPRRLFKQIPNAFRYHNGRRVPDHNFCPTSEEGLAIIRQNAEAYFRAHTEVDVFHLWPDDIPGRGWCACDRCRAYTPSEQAMLAANAVAEVLQNVNPEAQLAYLAYMDTEEVPTKVAPRHNVCLLWAPRSRCYAHATEDGTCAVNVPHYVENFREQVEHFRLTAARPPRVFEYYLDAILYKSLLPPLPTVMMQDLHFYRDAGAQTVQALMTGDRPWLAPQLNVWLFARLAWNCNQDLDALLADFCLATFGTENPNLPAYYRTLEQAFALALDIQPHQVKLEFDLSPVQFVSNPPADMGDPAFASPEILRRKCQLNAAISDLVRNAARHLEAAKPMAAPEVWTAERTEFELTRAWLGFDLSRVRLYDAVSSKPTTADAKRWLDETQSALNEVLAWGEAHITDPRFGMNFRFLHQIFWQLRISKIRADHFAGTLHRWILKLRSLVQTAWMFRRIRGIYND